MQALTSSDPRFLTLLFEEGLDPNHILVDRQSRPTLVHLAAELGNIHSITTVLRHGGSVTARDRQGRWPAHVAAEHAQVGALAVLLDHEKQTTGRLASLAAKEDTPHSPPSV